MTFEASRRKQNLVLQPRGKALYEDESTFASKLMAKMGWEKGKGLGKEQHGNLDFIQIRYKNNASGLGFQGLQDNQWTQHEDTFNSLLNKLNEKEANSGSNSGAEQEPVVEAKKTRKSLEEQSKKSRARVHYQKFTRGKDISRYSSKDLANIFGKKTLDEEDEIAVVEQEIVDDEKAEKNAYESTLIFNTGVSVSDYFKQKMEQKKKNSGLLAIETPESSFGEPSTSITKDLDLDINETVESETSKPEAEIKKSKKKKKKSLEAEIVAPESEDVIPENSLDDNSEKPKKKKRKAPETEAEQKDENDPIIEQLILAFEQDSENDKLKTKKIKKKKCKDKHNEVERPADERTSEETPKKKKSKSKSVTEEEAIEITEEVKTKKSKKKKRSQSTEETPEEPESKSKKQKLVEVPKPKTFGPEYITGMNVVYSTNVIQITSLTAKKLTNLAIKDFPDSNCANIVGYGLSEEIELKTVQTQMVDEKSQLDKYSLYNMVTSRDKIAPKKMLAKLRKPKNSFSVL